MAATKPPSLVGIDFPKANPTKLVHEAEWVRVSHKHGISPLVGAAADGASFGRWPTAVAFGKSPCESVATGNTLRCGRSLFWGTEEIA